MSTIGIFWFYNGQVIGKVRSLDDCIAVDGRIDSPDEHAVVWEEEPAFAKLRAAGKEYFEIPRGRVVWSQETNSPIIYMGERPIMEYALRMRIADFFNLDRNRIFWKYDEHYSIDTNVIDTLFDDA